MATKLTQSAKKQPLPGRSVMLTRFKLSQQKRQLREKERKTHAQKKDPEDKKTKASPTKTKKMKNNQTSPKNKSSNSECDQSKKSPNMLLKQKKEAQVTGRSCKRKLRVQKGTTSPPVKRIRPSDEGDRSQSPIYSELGFEEVIRMVEERQSLDDEDLLEILTCPSPVWWEDPPDDRYIEGPIVLQSSKKNSFTKSCNNNCLMAKPIRTKSARKTTPHKLILENNEVKTKQTEETTDNLIDATTFDNISKPNDGFSNKRSKLESLLSSIKNKIKEPQYEPKINRGTSTKRDIEEFNTDIETNIEKVIIDKGKITNCEEIGDVKANMNANQSDIENNDDVTFADITQQDKDCLRYLENIEIPIEGENIKMSKKTDVKSEEKSCTDKKKSSNTNEIMKTIKKSKTLPRFLTNRKLKILNIKKITAHGSINKSNSTNNWKKEKTGIIEMTKEIKQSIIQQNNIKPQTTQDEIKSDTNSESNNDIAKLKDTNSNIDDIHKNPFKSSDDDLVTVFKIISTDPQESTNFTNEDKMDIKEADEIDKDSKTLDCYYKKCKNSKWETHKNDKEETSARQKAEDGYKEESTTIKQEESGEPDVCGDCDKDAKIMIVPSTDVKYCLKCSSIFDLNECEYCIRQEQKMEHSGTLP